MKGQILLVDDNKDFLDSTKDVLEDAGYEVTPAHSGEEAVKLVKSREFDVVVMDIKMPGMNGVESYIEMKKIRPEIRTVMITAYSVEELIRQAMEEGAYGVLKKPLNMSSLFQTIEKVRRKGEGGFILLADDDKDLCDSLQDVLNDNGYKVAVAYDGKEAVRKAEEHPVDILLVDMKLPFMNGLEVYRRIKRITPDAVAIIISGYAKEMNDLILQMLDESAFTCLTKPIDMRNMLATLDSVCAAKHAGTYKKNILGGQGDNYNEKK